MPAVLEPQAPERGYHGFWNPGPEVEPQASDQCGSIKPGTRPGNRVRCEGLAGHLGKHFNSRYGTWGLADRGFPTAPSFPGENEDA